MPTYNLKSNRQVKFYIKNTKKQKQDTSINKDNFETSIFNYMN